MARRTPPRDSKGRFIKKSSARRRTRRNAPKRKAPKRKAPARRSYAKNPRTPDVVTMLMDGSIAASQVLVGKAVARSVPQMANLPKEGNVGLAVQAGVALATGYVASMFLSRGAAAALMAGGLSAPIETLIVANNVPFLSEALSPATVQASVNGYRGVGRYAHTRTDRQLGRYAHTRPMQALAGYPDGEDTYEDYAAY